MFAIVLGQIAGLVRGIIVARAFGASPELDAFFAANRVSETLFLLVAGGALGSAFIPKGLGMAIGIFDRKCGHPDPQPAGGVNCIVRPASGSLRPRPRPFR